jgi:hypothetical protein
MKERVCLRHCDAGGGAFKGREWEKVRDAFGRMEFLSFRRRR